MKENITEERKEEVNSESFRDQISTVNKEGKRKWVFPKKPSGRFYNARNIVSSILLLILFATPFIKVNGQPFMLFDISEQEFYSFRNTVWSARFLPFRFSNDCNHCFRNTFYCCVRQGILRMGLPANNFYGNGVP